MVCKMTSCAPLSKRGLALTTKFRFSIAES
ncbi:MAG: hypothetical protein ACI8S7_000559 [Candidatus Krumholzibacteriia bacterium]